MQTGEVEVGQQNREALVWASDQFLEAAEKRELREKKFRRCYTSAGEHHRIPMDVVEEDLQAALRAGKDARHPLYVRELFGAKRKRAPALSAMAH